MLGKSDRLARLFLLFAAVAALSGVALLPGCQTVESPVSAGWAGDGLYQADPAFPDSADSSQSPGGDPIPDLDDPTEPHP